VLLWSRNFTLRTLDRDRLIVETLQSQLRVKFLVSGSCMRPTFSNGDEIEVEAVSTRHLQLNDVVLVEIAGSLKVHRLIALTSNSALTRPEFGAHDVPVKRNAVLGVATKVNDVNIESIPYERCKKSLASIVGLV
jgi:hypothetical protein